MSTRQCFQQPGEPEAEKEASADDNHNMLWFTKPVFGDSHEPPTRRFGRFRIERFPLKPMHALVTAQKITKGVADVLQIRQRPQLLFAVETDRAPPGIFPAKPAWGGFIQQTAHVQNFRPFLQ